MNIRLISVSITFFYLTCSFSQDGLLDLSFGLNGKVMTPIGTSNDVANSIAIQPDGKIILVGSSNNVNDPDFSLARYNTDGTLDVTFDLDGKVVTSFGSLGEILYSVALQSDGKIVAVGKTTVSNYARFLTIRYNVDGSLDTTFGNFGSVVTWVGNYNSQAEDVAIQSDGKILVVGKSLISFDSFTAVRYNSDGSLDTTFGTNGIAIINFDVGTAYSVAIQNDGKIVLGGNFYNGSNNDFALIRLNEIGILDTTFDVDGKVTTNFDANNDIIYSLAIQGDGKIVVGGVSGLFPIVDFALARYNIDGSLDTNFDSDGKIVTSFSTVDDFGFSLAIQNDGKIVVAGYSKISNNKDFAVARYNVDGSLDVSFGENGKVTTPISNSDDIGNEIAIQNDGKIVVAGSSYNGSNTDFSLVRYNYTALATDEVEAIDKVHLIISPNPVLEQSVLHSNTFFENVTITFFNSLGKQLKQINNFSGHSLSINKNEFISGYYFAQVSKESKVIATVKFVILD